MLDFFPARLNAAFMRSTVFVGRIEPAR